MRAGRPRSQGLVRRGEDWLFSSAKMRVNAGGTPALPGGRLTALLLVLDALAFSAIWFGTYWFRDVLADYAMINKPINPIRSYFLALPIYLLFWFSCGWYYGLYAHRGKITGLNQLSALVKCLLAGLVGSLAIAYLFKQWDIGRFILLLSGPMYFVWLYVSRTALRRWKQEQVKRGIGVTNVIIIGLGRTARRAMNRIINHPEGGYRFVGFVDLVKRRRPLTQMSGQLVLGAAHELGDLLKKHAVDEVFLAAPRLPQTDIMNMVLACEHSGVQVKIVSNLFEALTSEARIDVIDEVPVVQLRNAQLPPLQAAFKRGLDLLSASILLIIFVIPMLLAALAIRLDSKGPALFTQERVGLGGRRFRLYKFRTMYVEAPAYAVAPTDPTDPRITRVGAFLRRFSLDEFPQLFNVLGGEMSMVGPRPEMPFLVEQYDEWQRRRLDVKPGVTGLWQIIGRKNLPLSLNMEYDLYYIKNQSLLFDVIILLKTVPAVLFGRGAF